MIVEFKEIPEANKATGNQDRFELFAREFLTALGYLVRDHPDRGADGGKDMLVIEPFQTINGQHQIPWLVSCKHKAHSGKSVNKSDEEDIRDRVSNKSAKGFMGFYSTLPSSGLNDHFTGPLRKSCYVEHYDSASIERHLTTDRRLDSVFRTFFPKSYAKFIKSGGYRIAETSFAVVDFVRYDHPPHAPKSSPPRIKAEVTVYGERVLKHANIAISESRYTHTIHNPVLLQTPNEKTLYLDVPTIVGEFTQPQQDAQTNSPYLQIHALIATDAGTFSQNTTVEISGGIFHPMHTIVTRNGVTLLTRKYHRPYSPINGYSDQLHA